MRTFSARISRKVELCDKQQKSTQMGAFHKAGFICRNRVGRCLGAAVTNNINLITGGRKLPPYDKRSTDIFVRTPFHTPCSQGIVCYTF